MSGIERVGANPVGKLAHKRLRRRLNNQIQARPHVLNVFIDLRRIFGLCALTLSHSLCLLKALFIKINEREFGASLSQSNGNLAPKT